MKLEKWATVAEIVSGVAVVVTLVVLVIGIRENTATVRATAAATSRDNLANFNEQALALSGENFELIARTFEPTTTWEDFTSSEQLWLQLFQRAFVQRTEAQYFRYRDGLLEEDAWETVRYRAWQNISGPVWDEIWQLDRSAVYTPGFVEAIESYEPP